MIVVGAIEVGVSIGVAHARTGDVAAVDGAGRVVHSTDVVDAGGGGVTRRGSGHRSDRCGGGGIGVHCRSRAGQSASAGRRDSRRGGLRSHDSSCSRRSELPFGGCLRKHYPNVGHRVNRASTKTCRARRNAAKTADELGRTGIGKTVKRPRRRDAREGGRGEQVWIRIFFPFAAVMRAPRDFAVSVGGILLIFVHLRASDPRHAVTSWAGATASATVFFVTRRAVPIIILIQKERRRFLCWNRRRSDLRLRPRVSRILFTGRDRNRVGGRSFLWDRGCPRPQATYPQGL